MWTSFRKREHGSATLITHQGQTTCVQAAYTTLSLTCPSKKEDEEEGNRSPSLDKEKLSPKSLAPVHLGLTGQKSRNLSVGIEFCQCFFGINCNELVISAPTSFYQVLYYIDSFSRVELSLHSGNKSHAVMVYDPFNMVVNLVCQEFCVNVHRGYWSVALFSCTAFAWLCSLSNTDLLE